ncbi:MAG: xanthine dehydrogenase family protein subunit M [Acidobacteria bacterium]|nr:xanthine dehydrogenase family protein subunit M [Acidobacteriota bacterium]MDA1233724.1 xanthine dehydrogenase family protein subunit M [Acidobacteriota bacterium]
MHPIEYECPQTLDDAVALFRRLGDNARALAGGTDLLVQMKTGRRLQGVVIDIKKIPEVNTVQCDPVKGLTLGAAVACYKIYGDDAVRAHYPGLVDAVEIIGGTPIQGRATVGGNLCNAAPSADAIPVLIAYNAVCHIVGPKGVRHVPVEEFCTAPGKNVLAADEILVALHLPPPPPHSGAAYLRFIPRNEMDIAVVGVGASVEVVDGRFHSVRVALASVAPTPVLVTEAGDALEGKPANAESIQVAADLAKAAAKPISDMRGTAEYRSHLCEVLTRRVLQTALNRALGQ